MRLGYWMERVDTGHGVAAWVARLDGKNDEAVSLLRQAADREAATEKSAVTPGAIQPARETLGELLLELKQPAVALAEYKRSEATRTASTRSPASAAPPSWRGTGPRPRPTTSSSWPWRRPPTPGGRIARARAFLAN